MNLILDVFVGFCIANKVQERMEGVTYPFLLSIIFFFMVVKAVVIWIILWFFSIFFVKNIVLISFVLNAVLIIFFLIKWNLSLLKIIELKKISLVNVLFSIFFLFLCIVIYNIIPYWWDELMYHLPITLELLNKWSWISDLWLNAYRYNDVWQRYPKNLYFVIAYFFSHIPNIIWFQVFGVFSFLFFLLNTKILLSKFLKDEKNNVSDRALLLILTIPVVFLHATVKVDVLLFSLLNLFIYLLFEWGKNKNSIFYMIFLLLLFFLIIWFKIISPFFLWVIICSFFIFQLIQNGKDSFISLFSSFFKIKIIFISCFIGCFFLYSYIANWIIHGDFLYPINNVKFDDNGSKSLSFWPTHYFKDFIISNYENYSIIKNWGTNIIFRWVYNFERWLWLMGILMVLGLILSLFHKKERETYEIFIYIVLAIFIFFSFNRLNILFWHRYQIFIYVLLTFIFVKKIIDIFEKKYKYIFLVVFLCNIVIWYPYIGSFIKKWDSLKQLFIRTRVNYCSKIDNLGDLGTNHFKKARKFFCDNISEKNIYLKRQNFNFYFYGKLFDNRLFNSIMNNKADFQKYIEKKNIQIAVTSNKNNLWGFFENNNQSFSTNFSINDTNVLFCNKFPFENIQKIHISYENIDPNDLIVNLWINDFEENLVLDKNVWDLEYSLQSNSIRNICFNLMNVHKRTVDADIEVIKFLKLYLIWLNWEKIILKTEDFSLENYEIEDKWLEQLWFNVIFTEDYLDDKVFIRKKKDSF